MPGDFLRDDLPGMLRETEFASVARVASGPHAGEDLYGILDQPPSEAFGVAGSDPAFIARDNTPPLVRGDVIEVDGIRFRVREPEPDRTGLTRYPLTEV